MHNKRLFYLISVKKLAPDHIKPTPQANALDCKLFYSEFSHGVMVLRSRQSPLYNQDLNFRLNFKSKLGRPVPDIKMIHFLNLKELHPEHILALYWPVYYQGLLNVPPPLPQCLKNLKFQLSWK